MRQQELTVFQLLPAIALQEGFRAVRKGIKPALLTTLGWEPSLTRKKRDRSVLAKAVREIRRPFNQLIDAVGKAIDRVRYPDREWRTIDFK
jgi:hypothetical protein